MEAITSLSIDPDSPVPGASVDGKMALRAALTRMKIDVVELSRSYASNRPFPHTVLRGVWSEALLSAISAECEGFDDWDLETKFFGSVGKRACSTWSKLPSKTRNLISYCNGPEFLGFLEVLTGEKGLIPDPHLLGGGIHSTLDKGFLKMHADFNWHPRLSLYRRINVLIYLNKDWEKSWGGELCLSSLNGSNLKVESTILPEFNTMVVFTTTDSSYHGHPSPMNLPANRARNSIALYYYLASKPGDSSGDLRLVTDYKVDD